MVGYRIGTDEADFGVIVVVTIIGLLRGLVSWSCNGIDCSFLLGGPSSSSDMLRSRLCGQTVLSASTIASTTAPSATTAGGTTGTTGTTTALTTAISSSSVAIALAASSLAAATSSW